MAEYIDKNMINERMLEYAVISGLNHHKMSAFILNIPTADVIERYKIDKAIAEIKELYTEWENSTDDAKLESNPFGAVLNILQRNIVE